MVDSSPVGTFKRYDKNRALSLVSRRAASRSSSNFAYGTSGEMAVNGLHRRISLHLSHFVEGSPLSAMNVDVVRLLSRPYEGRATSRKSLGANSSDEYDLARVELGFPCEMNHSVRIGVPPTVSSGAPGSSKTSKGQPTIPKADFALDR